MSNWQGVRGAIEELRSARAGNDPIDGLTARVAHDYANLLEAIGAKSPKIFTHGGDAIVFTWEIDGTSWYMTITEDGPIGVLGVPRIGAVAF